MTDARLRAQSRLPSLRAHRREIANARAQDPDRDPDRGHVVATGAALPVIDGAAEAASAAPVEIVIVTEIVGRENATAAENLSAGDEAEAARAVPVNRAARHRASDRKLKVGIQLQDWL